MIFQTRNISVLRWGLLTIWQALKISAEGIRLRYFRFKTETENIVLVEDAYKLPSNEISVVRVQSTGKATEIFIKTKWQVPVQISLQPQEYYTGSNNRPFHVKSFTQQELILNLHIQL